MLLQLRMMVHASSQYTAVQIRQHLTTTHLPPQMIVLVLIVTTILYRLVVMADHGKAKFLGILLLLTVQLLLLVERLTMRLYAFLTTATLSTCLIASETVGTETFLISAVQPLQLLQVLLTQIS